MFYGAHETNPDGAIGEHFDPRTVRSESRIFFKNLTPDVAREFLAGNPVDRGTDVAGSIHFSALGRKSGERIEIGVFQPALKFSGVKDDEIDIAYIRGNDASAVLLSSVMGFETNSVKQGIKRCIHDEFTRQCQHIIDLEATAEDRIGRGLTTGELRAMTIFHGAGFDAISLDGSVAIRNESTGKSFSLDNDNQWPHAMYLEGVPKLVIQAANIVKGIEIEIEREFDKKLGIAEEPSLDGKSDLEAENNQDLSP